VGFSLKNIGKGLKKIAKGALAGVTGGASLLSDRAVKNIKKKGLKAFTLGQITGQDRAKELAGQAEADALADPGPQGDKAPTEMPTMDMDAVQDYKRRKLLEAQARGGRQSTMLTNKDS